MAESTETVKLSLRLLIDEQKNKVVLAESEMGLESFQTEACKQVLLYPRSVNLEKYRKIKLKIDDTEAVKYFVCPDFKRRESCKRYYSISSTEACGCGEYENSKFVGGLMNREIQGLEEDQVQGSDSDEVFVSCETSFVITDDLKVASSSMDYVLNTLRGFGYANPYKLGEIVLDVGLSEILTLLECLFTSDSPLTDTFLRKQSSLCLTRSRIPLTPPTVQESGAGPDQTITLKAFVKKGDSKILCVESGADFIDLIFTFLALPLESVWDISGDSITLGCIGNVFRSFKGLNEGNEDSSSAKALLPSYYSCPKQLLDVVIEQREIYYYKFCRGETYGSKFTRNMPDCLNTQGDYMKKLYSKQQKEDAKVLSMRSFGFVRGYARFLVTDDLVIKLKDSVSNISLLKLRMHLAEEDVAEQMITIGKSEAIGLLRSSMMTSSALTTCFWNLIVKKAREET
ncbi:hypothetical protein ISN44_As08g009340 [Arabidopsis suecica]|uniref:DUF674 family protein n=1 Tax=Arabidopsis suecica TaxID=45249 RepID=A0A8T2B4W1_ARASU|nr:hypothetical protein ISN44_As08g009340 [Arabidopsis suecica]